MGERVENMYEVSQLVSYGMHGVCRIVDTEDRVIDHKCVTYFVLAPLSHPESRYYLPKHNPVALAKIRPLLDAETLQTLLATKTDQNMWVADENRRKQLYRQLISSPDIGALIQMVRCLYRYRREQQALGRRLHLSDENFLRDAERVLSGELTLVLQIPEKDVPAYLLQMLDVE